MRLIHLRMRVLSVGVITALIALAAAPSGIADTAAPTITVNAPVAGAIFDQQLHIEASASDADGLGRITFQADGKSIRSFTSHLTNGTPVGLTWKGARELSLGEHTITIIALDSKSSNPITHLENTAKVNIKVRRVDATALPKTPTHVSIALAGKGLNRTVTGRVTATKKTTPDNTFPLEGKVRVTWQIFSNGRFKTRHKDSDAGIAPYKLTQHLAGKGRWRVSVTFDPQAPYRASTSKTIDFTVR